MKNAILFIVLAVATLTANAQVKKEKVSKPAIDSVIIHIDEWLLRRLDARQMKINELQQQLRQEQEVVNELFKAAYSNKVNPDSVIDISLNKGRVNEYIIKFRNR